VTLTNPIALTSSHGRTINSKRTEDQDHDWRQSSLREDTPEWELLEFCHKNGIVLQAFAALGHSTEPKLPNDDPVITSMAKRVNKTPAQVLLASAVKRGTALLTTSKTPSRIQENFDISTSPKTMKEISEGIKTRQRFNSVLDTGVPGFIPRKVNMKTKQHLEQSTQEEQIREALNTHWQASAAGDAGPGDSSRKAKGGFLTRKVVVYAI
jgi:hypothetical protein